MRSDGVCIVMLLLDEVSCYEAVFAGIFDCQLHMLVLMYCLAVVPRLH